MPPHEVDANLEISTVSFDMEMRNGYSVVNCGDNTALVFDLLAQLRTALDLVIQDAKSTTPGPAYQAFFKQSSVAPFVSEVLTNVSTAVPLSPPALYSFSGGVTFMCMTGPEQFTFTLNGPRDGYDECLNNPSDFTKFPLFIPPKQYILLCPSFFSSGLAAVPPPNNCFTVSTYTNKFREPGSTLAMYQMWILLAAITQYLLYLSTRKPSLIQTLDVNKCFGLGSQRSSLNSGNYVYYAASESLLLDRR